MAARRWRFGLVLQCLLLGAVLPLAVRAEPDDGADEPPVVGRPANFSGAVGTFRVTARAEPTEVRAEQPLTYTVRVAADGPVKQPPSRPDLKALPEFAERFYVEDLPNPPAPPAGNVWEFTYRLKPKNVNVREIPAFPFVFYRPGVLSPGKGYQTDFADKIALTVKPAAAVQANSIQGAPASVQAPDWLYAIPRGDAVLRSRGTEELPALPLLLLLLVPPALCAGGYVLWVRAHPDAARQARQRRSRAARQALQALQRLDRAPADERAGEAASILADYLRQRTDLPRSQPTPAEAAAQLCRAGAEPAVAEKAGRFFAACDDARYAPPGFCDADDWQASATQLILTLEAGPWSSSPS